MEVMTIQRHIAQQQQLYREARGDFSALIRQIALAAKLIAAQVRRAGLLPVLGRAGEINVQGEEQQKLDVLANEALKRIFHGIGYVGGLASEEEEGIIHVPEGLVEGRYVLLFDPLDGSSNIDANVSIGTIFSVYRLNSMGRPAEMEDFLQRGRNQIAAGYVLYGSSTMLVYTAGDGVNGFTLDPSIGEFLLSHENIRINDACKVLSYNGANLRQWPKPAGRFLDHLHSDDYERSRGATERYIGSLVGDFHRNLLYGGVFLYRRTRRTRMANCACSTSATRSPSSPSKPAAPRRPVASASSTSRPRASTNVCRSPSETKKRSSCTTRSGGKRARNPLRPASRRRRA